MGTMSKMVRTKKKRGNCMLRIVWYEFVYKCIKTDYFKEMYNKFMN
jgi:hypothetical protein